MAEVKTLNFPNTPAGQKQKNETLVRELSNGWKIVSENVTPGGLRGNRACCFFIICMPCAFLAGNKDGTISVTLQHD